MSVAIVVAPHPGRSTGFTTVATNVASALGSRGWDVDYIGIGEASGHTPRTDETGSYTLHGASSPIELVACLDRIVRAADPCSRTGGRHPVVVFGRIADARLVDRAARWLDRRHELELTYYMAVDYAPLPAEVASLAADLDHVVPSSQFGAHALAAISPAPPIPHGVDIARFRPLTPAERARVRRETFGVDDDTVVISYFGRNSGHKRPDLALRAAAGLIRGASATCRRCGHVTAAELNADLIIGRVDRCRRCLFDELDPTAAQPNVVLYMHVDLTGVGAGARHAGGWDLQQLADRFAITDRVMFCTDAVPVDEIAKRMAACDIHVLLQECGGWELTVLETAACGVPNVITDVAAPPEYAAPFSIVVPAGTDMIGRFGARGQADLDAAAVALHDLARDRDQRVALGRRGVEVAASYSWDRIGEAWAAHVARATGAR